MVTKKKLTKEEWEAMTGTDMSLILPSDGSIETARESSLNDTGKEKAEGTVEQTDSTFEPQQPSTGKEEAVPVSQRRISNRQRKLSLDEYRKAFLQVPRIEDRKPVFVSGEVRDIFFFFLIFKKSELNLCCLLHNSLTVFCNSLCCRNNLCR